MKATLFSVKATRFSVKVALLSLLFAASLLPAQSPFQFRELGPASLELSENGKPVFVYNHGMKLPAGMPEDRRRSSYLHPVYAPDGTVVTDDSPKDHLHHRGIFWTWPIVRVGGDTYDQWLLKGARDQFVRWIENR